MTTPVAATRDTLSTQFEHVRKKVASLFNRVKESEEIPQKTLKGIIEEQAMQDYIGIEDIKHLYPKSGRTGTIEKGIEDIKHLYPKSKTKTTEKGFEDIKHLYRKSKSGTNEEATDDVQYLYDEHDMRLIADGRRIKTWRITSNLNKSLTDTIMWKTTLDIEMRTKVIYSFKCWVYRGNGEVAPYNKMKGSIGTLTSLQEIRDFIKACEAKRLDLEDHEFWDKAYLPPERTIETPESYEGKVLFDHVQIKLITTNEPLLGCGPLPDWLRKKRCIYAVDGKNERNDNLCVWQFIHDKIWSEALSF